MSDKKQARNKKLVKLRKANPVKWTWGTLAQEFNISRPRAVKIFQEAQEAEARKLKH